MLTSQARPGHCSNCGRWLGMQYAARMDIHASHLDDEELWWQQWIVLEMGKLIAAAPALIKLPQMESFAEAVEAYLYEVADGNVSAVARKFRVAKKTVREVEKRCTATSAFFASTVFVTSVDYLLLALLSRF